MGAMKGYRLTGSAITFVKPSIRDPRVTMICSLIFFVTLSQLYLGFTQNRIQIAVALGTCTVLDVLLTFLNSRTIGLPLSGIISGLGLCLLLDSGTRVLPFLFAGILCIGSKYALRLQGKHFYNPSAFALAILILLNLGTLTPGYEWGGGTTALWIVLSLGFMLLTRVRRLVLLGSFLGLFLVSAGLRVVLGMEPASLAFGILTGAPFQLFTFFMLTDPRTTPKSNRLQFLFAGCIVAIDFVLRLLRIHNTLVLSLFVVDSGMLLLGLGGMSYAVNRWPGRDAALPGPIETPAPPMEDPLGGASQEPPRVYGLVSPAN